MSIGENLRSVRRRNVDLFCRRGQAGVTPRPSTMPGMSQEVRERAIFSASVCQSACQPRYACTAIFNFSRKSSAPVFIGDHLIDLVFYGK